MASMCIVVLCGLFVSMASGEVKLLLIDSDGGADDATAILQVLREPSVNLLAITCVYGNVHMEQACDNIRRTLEVADMADQVPVFPGSTQPIIGTPVYDNYYGYDGFGNASQQFPLPDVNAKNEHAAIAIASFVNMYPGQITLISLGPLTNLALAVQLDPTIPSKLKQLTMMAGSSDAIGNVSPVAEFNVIDDPIAASVVINAYSAGCHLTIMTLDMCSEYPATWEWYDNWVSTNTTEAYFISQIFAIGNENSRLVNETFQCCDLQTTTAVLYPQVINDTDHENVQVEVCGAVTRGEMVVDYRNQPAKSPNAYIYSAINLNVMLDLWNDITGYDPDDNSTASGNKTRYTNNGENELLDKSTDPNLGI